jgi:hypothetical protein
MKSFRFFTDILSISCELIEKVEGHYSNCSNKNPRELKPKEQVVEIVFDRIETATPGAVVSVFDWSFGNLFKNKKDQIIFTIIMIIVTVVIAIIFFLYCYCNRTKTTVIVVLVLQN